MAVAAFSDTGPDPLFPRWAGYYNVWSVILILPDQLLFFFQTGPFAWNGVVGLWIPAASFGAWFLVTAHLLRKSLGNGDVAVAGEVGMVGSPSSRGATEVPER